MHEFVGLAPGDRLRWWRHRAPAGGLVVEAPGGGSGQKLVSGSRLWEGAAGTWPEPSPHTVSNCVRLTGHMEVGPALL